MKRRFRLTQSADFERVRRYGRRFAHPLVVLVMLEKKAQADQALVDRVGKSRFAVVAGRALGSAVKRNRAKRLIRAALLPYIENVKPGWDILLIARQPFIHTDLSTAQKTLEILFKRADLLITSDEHA